MSVARVQGEKEKRWESSKTGANRRGGGGWKPKKGQEK